MDIAEAIKQAYKTEPFKPFSIVLTDGRKFDINHPGEVWVALRSHLCVIKTGADSYQFVDTSYLRAIEPKAA
ncbi:MAG: hypothetical protein M5U25_16630 [Planctomycetota bacterium]|nr:hypothetical protein [Planctomycetota bacterium]